MPRPGWVQNLVPWGLITLAISLVVAILPINPLSSPETLLLLLAGTGESAVLYLLLWPRSVNYSPGRSLAALTALLAASTFWAVRAPTTPHPPYLVHLMWLMGMTVVVCGLLGYSLWQRLMARHRPHQG